MLSNTYATFEAQFMKKISNTEAELKKSFAYKRKRVPLPPMLLKILYSVRGDAFALEFGLNIPKMQIWRNLKNTDLSHFSYFSLV